MENDYDKMDREKFDILFFKRFRKLIWRTGVSGQKVTGFCVGVGSGWRNLIWKMMEDLEKLPDSPDVFYMKEKFGSLRVELLNGSDEVYTIINKAEEESYKICEECGEPGTPNDKGWIKTLCEKCRKKGG